MPVRKTESRIPGGFEKAEKLGYVSKNNPAGLVMISYLGESIPYDSDKFPFYNKYVVFVDEDTISESQRLSTSYEWQIELIDAGENEDASDDTIIGNLVYETENGVLFFSEAIANSLSLHLSNDVANRKLRISVKVSGISDPAPTLSITHSLESLDERFEDFIKDQIKSPTAGTGSAYLTRYLRYFFGDYFLEAVKEFDSREGFKIEVNLIVAIAYQNLLRQVNLLADDTPIPYTFENDDLERQLNNGTPDFTSVKGHIGLCEIRPHILSMFLSTDSTSWFTDLNPAPFIRPVQKFDELKNQQQLFESLTVESETNNFDHNKLIDLYNALRFPKSNINLATFLTNELKNSIEEFRNIEAELLPSKNREVSLIINKFYSGPADVIADMIPSAKSVRVFQSAWSLYVQEILKSYAIPYKKIEIRVLDLRSGNPITNAKIKQLQVYKTPLPPSLPSGNMFTQHFEYGSTSYPIARIVPSEEDSVLKAAQKALYRMKEMAEGTTRSKEGEDGDGGYADDSWGNGTADDFNIFWNSIDPYWADVSGDVQPSDIYLNEIIETYNSHAFTDDKGVLSVRVPLSYFSGNEVFIKVSFFEFATVLERLGNQESLAGPSIANPFIERPELNAENANPHATGFKASWELAATDTQKINWDDYMEDDDHFGWKVTQADNGGEAMLKAVQKLTVKNFDGLLDRPFSFQFHKGTEPYHFVLFGMQWCQPIFDGVTDNDPSIDTAQRVNFKTVVQRRLQDNADSPWVRGHNMHIVTNIAGSSNQYYAFFNSPVVSGFGRSGGHDSVDIYSGRNSQTNIFSIIGGEFVNYQNSNSFGNFCVVLRFNYISSSQQNVIRRKCFHYAHLSERSNFNNQIIPAGAKIGLAGRLGNFVEHSPSHLHLQLLDDTQNAGISTYGGILNQNNTAIEAYTLFEDFSIRSHVVENNFVLPSNRLPLMLPCECIYGDEMEDSPQNCQFMDKVSVTGSNSYSGSNSRLGCWAIRKFPEYDFHTPRGNRRFPEPPLNNDRNPKKFFFCPYVHYKPRTTLKVALNDSISTDGYISVEDTSGFPSQGWLMIGDEIIKYKEITDEQFIIEARGISNTLTSNHLYSESVHLVNLNLFAVQSYLKYLYVNRITFETNHEYLDPGEIDGAASDVVQVDLANTIPANTEIIIEEVSGLYSRISQGNQALGWIASSALELNSNGQHICNNAISSLLSAAVTSDTLNAIYNYRIEMGLDITFENYANNFQYDDLDLTRSLNLNVLDITLPHQN